MLTQHMLELVLTVWLGTHMVGATSMGIMPASDGKCHDRARAIVNILSKKQLRYPKHKRVRFKWGCFETPVLGA